MFHESYFIDVLLLLATVFSGILSYFLYSFKYWEKKGVPFLTPHFPKGNSLHYFMNTNTFGIEGKIWYDELKKRGCPFGGVWTFTRPVLVLVDPKYIRDILTKDFPYFVDRDLYCNEKDDPKSAHLFIIRSSGWKNTRAKLTPTFTSGKIKMMFNAVVQCSNYMIDSLEKDAVQKTDVDIRDVLACYTIDVIGTVAFGVESNSFKNPDTDFRQMGHEIFAGGYWNIFRQTIARNFPGLARKIGLTLSRKIPVEFFQDLVENTVIYREQNGFTRPDFMQLLIDLKNETKDSENPFTMNQIIANVLLFFIAGFDTSTTTMNFSLYELAKNQEIQEKARQEIERVLEKHGRKITYESIKDMTYVRQIIDEAIRMYPPLPVLGRTCIKDYKLGDTDITIEKGTPVIISNFGLGWDEQYFPNPEKFDPDRFSPENKANLTPYVHLPFGEGPRNCIGLRFGAMQSTLGLVTILRKFKISISPRTKIPLTIDSHQFLTKSNETLYLKLQKIEDVDS